MPARELPPRPDLDQYRKQAKDLLRDGRAGEPGALQRLTAWRRGGRHAGSGRGGLSLADAQFVLAREHGFASWPAFVRHVEGLTGHVSPDVVWRRAEKAIRGGDVAGLESLLRDHGDVIRTHRPAREDDPLAPDYAAGDARTIIADEHHFEAWAQFAAHARACRDSGSPAARFEAAVDAIVEGDVAALERLVEADPSLVRTRSARKHHATLLHYVGANGVEGFRQRTPKTAVRIADVLLRAGADVDAMADMYGGATTLGLVATSVHPERAGLQAGLIDALLAHGARMDHPGLAGNAHKLVTGCLANGRDDAAALLVERGAPVDLEGAAGVGRLDLVASFFEPDGRPKPAASGQQMARALLWASAYGRTDVVEFLLARGIDAGTPLPRSGAFDGETALHLAAFWGQVGTLKALLRWRAPLEARDARFGTTPLCWALHAWAHEPGSAPPERHVQVVALLVAAGATVEPQWLEAQAIRADPAMLRALEGQTRHKEQGTRHKEG
jgi:hypothetical protein